jgi:hypothetical protein
VLVLAGAIVPDVSMFFFYLVEKFFRGTSEQLIWSQAYWDPRWQVFLDVFNSVLLIGAGLLVGMLVRSKLVLLFFASMLVHVVSDFLLHHDDGHRHFPRSAIGDSPVLGRIGTMRTMVTRQAR